MKTGSIPLDHLQISQRSLQTLECEGVIMTLVISPEAPASLSEISIRVCTTNMSSRSVTLHQKVEAPDLWLHTGTLQSNTSELPPAAKHEWTIHGIAMATGLYRFKASSEEILEGRNSVLQRKSITANCCGEINVT